MTKQPKDREPPRAFTADEIVGFFKSKGYDFRYNVVTNKDEVIFHMNKIRPRYPAFLTEKLSEEETTILASLKTLNSDAARFEDKWTDIEDRTIKYFQRTVAIDIFNEYGDPSLAELKKPKIIQDSIDDYSYRHSYDPFDDYFRDCQIHHLSYGGDPLSELLSLIKVPEGSTEVLYKGLAAWLMGVVATALSPDKLFQNHMLILVGRQGTGKTLFFRTLFRDLYPTYFNESAPSVFEKDVAQKLSSNICWLYDDANFSERNSSIDMLKALLTRGHSNERIAYGQRKTMFKRRVSFAATTNRMAFLNDSTGDRRFLCIEIENIDIDALRTKLDIKALWGQIVSMYLKGNHEVPDVREVQEKSNEQFRGENPLHLAISSVVETTNDMHNMVFLAEITKYLTKKDVIEKHRGQSSNEVIRAFADMKLGKKGKAFLTSAKRDSVCFLGVRWRPEVNVADIPDYSEKDHRFSIREVLDGEAYKVVPIKKLPWFEKDQNPQNSPQSFGPPKN